jgi:hypothetical protein
MKQLRLLSIRAEFADKTCSFLYSSSAESAMVYRTLGRKCFDFVLE